MKSKGALRIQISSSIVWKQDMSVAVSLARLRKENQNITKTWKIEKWCLTWYKEAYDDNQGIDVQNYLITTYRKLIIKMSLLPLSYSLQWLHLLREDTQASFNILSNNKQIFSLCDNLGHFCNFDRQNGNLCLKIEYEETNWSC